MIPQYTFGAGGRGKHFLWLKEHAVHAGDECLQWPFGTDGRGYGTVGFMGYLHKAHRLMCELAHGLPPTRDHEAAHECGNRICVNPHHLSWKTRTENAADMIAHGTARFGRGRKARKLTAEQVAEIIALKGLATQMAIAERFGVTHKQISKIHLGQAWRPGKPAARPT